MFGGLQWFLSHTFILVLSAFHNIILLKICVWVICVVGLTRCLDSYVQVFSSLYILHIEYGCGHDCLVSLVDSDLYSFFNHLLILLFSLDKLFFIFAFPTSVFFEIILLDLH